MSVPCAFTYDNHCGSIKMVKSKGDGWVAQVLAGIFIFPFFYFSFRSFYHDGEGSDGFFFSLPFYFTLFIAEELFYACLFYTFPPPLRLSSLVSVLLLIVRIHVLVCFFW